MTDDLPRFPMTVVAQARRETGGRTASAFQTSDLVIDFSPPAGRLEKLPTPPVLDKGVALRCLVRRYVNQLAFNPHDGMDSELHPRH